MIAKAQNCREVSPSTEMEVENLDWHMFIYTSFSFSVAAVRGNKPG